MGISEIAVIIGEDGRTVPLIGPGRIVIFQRIHGVWQSQRTFPFALEPGKGLQGLHRKVAELVTFLGDCRVFVAQSANGAVYSELARARCHIWEVAGQPEEFLDSVCLEVKDDDKRVACTLPDSGTTGIPVPLETAPGKFTLSITEIQRKRSGVSSKQVLQQFIRSSRFTEIELFCEHLPPWIGVEADFLGLQVETRQHAPHEVRVSLKKPQ
jgi:Fe-only nitrogenase accessory protein AnfO